MVVWEFIARYASAGGGGGGGNFDMIKMMIVSVNVMIATISNTILLDYVIINNIINIIVIVIVVRIVIRIQNRSTMIIHFI